MEIVKYLWHTAQNLILCALPVFFACTAIEPSLPSRHGLPREEMAA